MPSRIRIILVDDNVLFRLAVRALLRLRDTMTVIAETADGDEAVRLASELTPDVIIIDVNLSGLISGIEATRRITSASASDRPRPLVIACSASDAYQEPMARAGAAGFVSKMHATQLPALITSIVSRERAH
ncbi:MAG TPA: response regulator transcription factor [Tepidisphaeraceae bacterium]|jgi:two-component system response regulator DesR